MRLSETLQTRHPERSTPLAGGVKNLERQSYSRTEEDAMSKKWYGLWPLVTGIVFFQCTRDFSPLSIEMPVRELTSTEKALVNSGNSFGYELFHEVVRAEKDKNIFISPLSVSMALAMTYNGAAGETEEAMRTTLGFASLTREQVNEAFKSLVALLLSLDPQIQLQIANSIWYRQGYTVQPEFVSLNRNFFAALVQGLDFNDPNAPNIINAWVDQNTNGKIKKIIGQIDSLTVMFLINAIYFKGTWTYQFDKAKTQEDWFSRPDGVRVPCKMMVQTNAHFLYHSTDELQIIDLPYGRGLYSMTIILPRPHVNVDSLIVRLDAATLAQWVGSLREQQGTLYLPKLKLEYELLMNDVLKAMGMAIAFSRGADFSRMFVEKLDLYISRVLHKTFVQVDEEGTEAAAVTAVEISLTSAGPNGFIMRVDRPFVFLIRENHSQTVLFAGKIIEPRAG